MLGHCYIVFTLIAASARRTHGAVLYPIANGGCLIFVKWLVSTVVREGRESEM